MNEHDLTDSLHQSLPPRPSTQGWADGARRKARRRRIGFGAAAVLAVAALVTPLAWQNLRDPGIVASPAPASESFVSPEPSPQPTAPVTLPDERGDGLLPRVCEAIRTGELPAQDLPGTEQLPDGVARVWLCGDRSGSFDGQVGPIEPLTTDPDRIVDAINALPASTAEACTAIGGLTYHVVLVYPDGNRRVIAGETVNCEFVGGWGGREGGAALLDELEGMWTAQREATASNYSGEPRVCNRIDPVSFSHLQLNSFLPVTRQSITRGYVCGLPAGSDNFDVDPVQIEIPSSLISAFAQAAPSEPAEVPYEAGPYAVLLNEHGDPLTYRVSADGLLPGSMGTEQDAWYPTGDLLAQWRDTLTPITITPFYSLPPECGSWDPERPGDPADVSSGFACLNPDALPTKGPELDPAFARELGRRFAAESREGEPGEMSSLSVLLLDSTGRAINLYWDAQSPPSLVGHGRSWRLPDDVVAELENYGFTFTQA